MPTVGSITKKYISSLTPIMDVREIIPQLLNVTNEDVTFSEMMRLANRFVITDVPEYNFAENEELYAVETVKAGGVSEVTATLKVVDVTLVSVDGASFPRVGDVVLVPGANKRTAWVSARTAGTGGSSDVIRIVSVTGQSLEITTGMKLSVLSQASGEGGSSPTARRYGVTRRKNNVQIFKEAVPKITDIQNASKVEFTFKGQPYYMLKAQYDSKVGFDKNIQNQFLFGEGTGDNFSASSPTITDASGNPVSLTKSLNQYVKEEGLSLVNQTVNLAFFKTLDKALNKKRTGKLYGVLGGTEMNHAWDDLFQALGSANVSSAARWDITGKDLELGIDKVKLYGRTYAKMPLTAFDEQNIINFTGSAGHQGTMFFIPLDQAKAYGGGQVADRIRVRYMPLPSSGAVNVTSDGITREIVLGGLAPIATSEESVFQIHYETIQGLEVLSASHFAVVSIAGFGS